MPRARAAVSRNEYVPEFGRVVRILEYDRPMQSDDVETAQTVSYMDELAAADASDPAIVSATAEALEDAGIDMSACPMDKAHAVYWWLKRTIRYVPTPGTSPLVDQTLITPCAVLAMPEPIGDCPQFSMLACAMFRVLCMESMFVTIKAEQNFPDLWSHIYNTVEVYPNQFLPFDSSNGPEPGAEYARPFARKVWPRIQPSRCRSKEQMLRNTYAGRAVPSMRNRALRGALGDVNCDADGNCVDTSTGDFTAAPVYSAPGVTDPTDCLYGANAATGGCNAAPAGLAPISTPAPTSSSNLLSTLLTDVGSIGTSLVKSATQQKPYYITGPNGQQVLYNPNTGSVAAGATIASAINPTVLLFAVLGIGAAALLGGKK